MPAVDTLGTEAYWTSGLPYEGSTLTISLVGTEYFWKDGVPVIYLAPPTNEITGKFFFYFF
jgi:hypothetical protein